MQRFDDDGRLIVPERTHLVDELKKRGVHLEGSIHIHQAFCPRGHMLVSDDNKQFNGLPGIKVHVVGERGDELVTITPFLKRRDRIGGEQFQVGDRLHICCPACGIEMPVLAPCDCQWNGEFVMFSLDENPTNQNAVCFCNIWGCPNGDIRMAGDVIAEYQRNYEL
ncbi:hypothetical protein GX586_06085 [bacterium]|nr:hypothetical protein [bacterium]